jgi:phage gpG-like protein
MDFNEFNKQLLQKAQDAKKAMNQQLGPKVAAVALRFIDDNFRMQGWQNGALNPWVKGGKDGTVLVKSGALKRSFNSEIKSGQVRIYTNVKYAAVHNEGFKGEVSVKAHKRSKFKKSGAKKKRVSTGEVQAHTRQMDIPQRQFAPTAGSESESLNTQVKNTIESHLKHILKP